MHALPLLTTITLALVMAAVGGLAARVFRLPTTVGYLLAGVAIGPYSPGLVGNTVYIAELAELGIVLLMFGVGLHFSLRDLWRVRTIALPGALLNSTVIALLGFVLARSWQWPPAAALLVGLAVSIASTVVMLRGLADSGLLASRAGQVVVGWLVLEDLLTVVLLIALPVLFSAGSGPDGWLSLVQTLSAAGLFVGLMLLVAPRLLPRAVGMAARSGARELLVIAAAAIALGTAYLAGTFFGVSLALGAFLAGLVVARTDQRRQVAADVQPLREVFAVLFFVSVGMLVDPLQLLRDPWPVLSLTLLIVLVKPLLTLLIGLLLPADPRTLLVAAAGRNQIGEFSFLLAQGGVQLGVLTEEQRMVILMAAVLAISLNPAAFRLLAPLERRLLAIPILNRWFERRRTLEDGPPLPTADHVVIVGYGRVGSHLGAVLDGLQIPRLVVEVDSARADEFREAGIPTLFGDAANSDVLTYAGLPTARALVVTLPDETATALVVGLCRTAAPQLPIIARATTQGGVRRLRELGAVEVIHPEFEGGVEVLRSTLRSLEYPAAQVQDFIDRLREEQGDVYGEAPDELERLKRGAIGMQLDWQTLGEESGLVGSSLGTSAMRSRSGASLIAVIRNRQLLTNPGVDFVFERGDLVGLIGTADQIEAARALVLTQRPIPRS